MAEIDDLQEELDLSRAALRTLLNGGQSVTVLGRNIARADYKYLTERIDELTKRIKALRRGGIRLQRMVGNGD